MTAPYATRKKKMAGLSALASGALREGPLVEVRSAPTVANAAHPAASGPEIEIAPPKYFPGDLIVDKYRLVRLLGEGGMGAVWLAHNLALDVDVALKLIRHEGARPDASERLQHEARVAAKLGHPAIVRVYDFGETQHHDPFIVMEVLQGESLGAVLDRKGRLPAENAVLTLLPIANALVAAHRRGIVHRDLKPDNIVLTTSESGALHPKLVDFGIAKQHRDEVDRSAPVARPSSARGVTLRGTIVGSPEYMAPEQAVGAEDIDARTDVWGLAVVLYEAVTGRRPFEGETVDAVLLSILDDAPTPCTELGAGDPELWRIVARALEKERDDRWQTMWEFGLELARWARARGLENDIAGGSLELSWLSHGARPPSSDQPPPGDSARLLIPAPLREALRRAVDPASIDEALDDGAARPSSVAAQPSPDRKAAPLPDASIDDLVPASRHADDASLDEIAPTASHAPDAPPPPDAVRAGGRTWRSLGVVSVLAAALAFVGLLSWRSMPAGGAVAAGGEGDALPPGGVARPSAVPTTMSEPAKAPPTASAARAAPQPPGDAASCVVPLFAPGAFTEGAAPDVETLCGDPDPRRGAMSVKTRVIRGSRSGAVTVAMQEWAQLEWYELAAVAMIRGRCCAAPRPLELPPPVGSCSPMKDALASLERAVRAGGDTESSIAEYRKAVWCTIRSGLSTDYPYAAELRPGAESALRAMLARVGPSR